MKSILKTIVVSAVGVLASFASVQAAVLVTAANTPGNVGVALWSSCNPAQGAGPALTVTACLAPDLINVTGNESLTINGGQAVIDAADGFFTSGGMTLANATRGFSLLGFNVNSTATNQNPSNISFVVNFLDAAGIAGSLASAPFVTGPGGNQFMFDTTAGFVITTVSFTAAANAIDDIKQIRFNAVDRPTTTNVPLPGTLALLGLGMVVFARRFRF